MQATDNRRVMRKSKGGVLISVLVFAGIISLFLAGVGTLAVSHFTRAAREADRAAAIQLADAGINYELRWISDDIRNVDRPHQLFPTGTQNGPYSGSIPGMPGTFRVYVTKLDGTGPWVAPNEVLLTCEGTVNGVTRAAQITGEKKGVFEEYAIYSTTSLTFGGNDVHVEGNVGSNVNPSFNGNTPADINGVLTINGAGGTAPSGGNVQTTPTPINWPTIDQIADDRFPGGGLAWLRTNNNNSSIKMFSTDRAADPNFDLGNAVNGGITSTTYKIDKNTFTSFTVDNNINDDTGGSRYATASSGLYGRKVVIFPPGDYYFTELKFLSNGPAFLFDTARGRIRIWVTQLTSNDQLDNVNYFTSSDATKFRLYYNKCAALSIDGTSTFYGSIYSIVAGCTSTVTLAGNSALFGSLIGMDVRVIGNSEVTFPNDGGSSDDFALWFGFRNTWKEVNPGNSVVFPDGTSN